MSSPGKWNRKGQICQELLSHPTNISERWQDISVTPSGHKLLLLALIFPICSPTPFFPHLCNFLAHKYYKGYFYNAELMLLISSGSSRADILSTAEHIIILTFFLEATKEFTSWKQIYWHVGDFYVKCYFPLCYRILVGLIFQAYIRYKEKNLNTWVPFQTFLSTQFSTSETGEWLKGTHYC